MKLYFVCSIDTDDIMYVIITYTIILSVISFLEKVYEDIYVVRVVHVIMILYKKYMTV